MYCRYLLKILFCCWLGSGSAQTGPANSSDSIVFKKADQAFALAFKNPDSALLLANEALGQATALKSELAMANAWNAIGWTMMHKGHLDSSVIYLQKARQLFSAAKSDDNIVRNCINLAEVYTKQSKISEAIQLLTQADSICVKTGNLAFHTNVKRQLGIVYRESGDYKKALEYLKEAMDGFAKTGDHFRYVGTATSISILYRNLKMMDSSLAVLRRSQSLTKEQTKSPYQIAMVEEHLAETYFGMENYKEALLHYQTAYGIFEKMNNKADLAFESFSIGKTLARLGQYAEAEKYLLRSYALNDSLKMLNYQLDASHELAFLYKRSGNWQKAFGYLQKAAELKDSIDVSEQRQKTNELKEKFEAEKKEQEISLLKATNQLTEANNKRTRLLQYIFILLFLASVIISWLLLNRFRMKKKLEAQLLRNQIAGDLHDDIGSALSSIDISSRIALVKQENKTAVAEQLTKIQQLTRNTMESMGDIVWSINPRNDNVESMLMRMREFAAEICEPLQIGLQFNISKEVENISTDSNKRRNIFFIYKEAVNNAAKYSECSVLTISLDKTGNQFNLIVTDNGKGFNEETVKKGNGLYNMRTRARHLQGRLSISSTAGQGTTIALSCPV